MGRMDRMTMDFRPKSKKPRTENKPKHEAIVARPDGRTASCPSCPSWRSCVGFFVFLNRVTAPSSPSLRLELDVPPEARVGSTVRIALRVTNIGSQPIELYLRGRTVAFDVVVRHAAGEVVWRRLENQVIPAIVRLETLRPEQSLELRTRWHLAVVPPGIYVIEGILLTDGPDLRTVALQIRVI